MTRRPAAISTAGPDTRANCDILLLFPGVTEARFFPYLSLPHLTGYLRGQGLAVAQRDLNIELTYGLVEAARAVPGDGAIEADVGEFRRKLYDFVSRYRTEIYSAAFDGRPGPIPGGVAERVVRNVVDSFLDDSALVASDRRVSRVVEHAAAPLRDGDRATLLHDRLALEAIERARPNVVGLSIAFPSQLVPALRIARLAKQQFPPLKVALGGQQIMLRWRELATVPGLFEIVDVLGVGPGERTLAALAEAVPQNGAPTAIPDAVTAATSAPVPSGHHLRDNPPPVFDGLPFHRYMVQEPQLPVISCVGCYWGRCVFCSYGNRSLGGGYQQLTANQLADVCVAGLESTGSRRITFADENSNLRLLLRTAQILRSRGFDFVWSTRNRLEPSMTDPAFCRALADSGCVLMSVGYETNSQRLLDKMDKGIDADTYQTIIDNLDEVGITLRLSLMGGLFDETPDEAAASRQFLVQNAEKVGVDVAQMLVVEPSTRLADAAGDFNLALTTDGSVATNDGFSYLGGRLGPEFEYVDGLSRDGRREQLRETNLTFLPGKNLGSHPRFRSSLKTSPPVKALRLHPWVTCGAGDGHDLRLVDLCWAVGYNLDDDIELSGEQTMLHAKSARSQKVLELLQAAGVGSNDLEVVPA